MVENAFSDSLILFRPQTFELTASLWMSLSHVFTIQPQLSVWFSLIIKMFIELALTFVMMYCIALYIRLDNLTEMLQNEDQRVESTPFLHSLIKLLIFPIVWYFSVNIQIVNLY